MGRLEFEALQAHSSTRNVDVELLHHLDNALVAKQCSPQVTRVNRLGTRLDREPERLAQNRWHSR